MKQFDSKKTYIIFLAIVLLQNIVSFFFWSDTLNKVVYLIASAIFLLISLHKYEFIVLKNKHKQSLVCGCWNSSLMLCIIGYILLFIEEMR